ncbi:protein phosphatase 2C domain-containing protein [Streptomyces sp. NPDC047434]|uniref:protein phosphatase 2C domain-containing protein n=1 Tax=Streptomyces sp. NPDC047434 TaxID=3155143 RepID=UPI0033FDEFD0
MRLPEVEALASSSPCPGRANEDFVAWNDHVAVVVDGAGMPETLRAPCTHGVSWFAETLGTSVCAAAGGGASLQDVLASAIERTAHAHRHTCAVDDPLSPSATLAALRWRDDTLEWLVLGDCTLVVDHRGRVEAISDTRLEAVARTERAAMKSAPPGSAERQRLHTRLVEAERACRNRPGGYWVAASDPQVADAALYGAYAFSDVSRAALLTDGAARLVNTFGLADWAGCLDLLEEQGTASLISRVRDAELSDSALICWPRSKPHDDATVAYVCPR